MRALLVAALLLVGCSGPVGDPVDGVDGKSLVSYFHDDEHGVSCWVFGTAGTTGKAISCLPDAQIR